MSVASSVPGAVTLIVLSVHAVVGSAVDSANSTALVLDSSGCGSVSAVLPAIVVDAVRWLSSMISSSRSSFGPVGSASSRTGSVCAMCIIMLTVTEVMSGSWLF